MKYPLVDPIPIPAPVWLMKGLSLLTLALHFAAVMIVVGSLLGVIWFNLSGHLRKSDTRLSAASVLNRRLPVILTFAINLGVPPLLFAQVLYGRAIYTSSILIARPWLSVIPMLMAAYYLVYVADKRIKAQKPAWMISAISLVLVLAIGQIYATNMTLMLRPEIWQALYAQSAFGNHHPSDPTTTPRWLFVMAGGLLVGGLWFQIISNIKHVATEVTDLLRVYGGRMAVVGGVLQIACAYLTVANQPATVLQGLGTESLATVTAIVYLAGGLLCVGIAFYHSTRKASSVGLAAAATTVGVVAEIAAVIYRDRIRDVTLFQKGYDVWARTENTNWFVIGLFLLLFVGALAVVGWLLMVMKSATPPREMIGENADQDYPLPTAAAGTGGYVA